MNDLYQKMAFETITWRDKFIHFWDPCWSLLATPVAERLKEGREKRAGQRSERGAGSREPGAGSETTNNEHRTLNAEWAAERGEWREAKCLANQ